VEVIRKHEGDDMNRFAIDRRSALIGGSAVALGVGLPRFGLAQAQPRRGGVLTAQTYSDLHTLNPAMRTSYAIHVFTSRMIEPLVDLGPNFEYVPKLAVSWQSSKDGKTITFKLRPNVKWHDGKPFTSADVQFCALEMWRKYQNYGTLLHKDLEAVDTPDPLTAVFHYAQAMPLPLLLRAAPELCYVVPRHMFEGTDLLKNPTNLKPVGTGPFKFVDYQPDRYLIVERNPDYWMPGLPYLDRVIVRVIPDASAVAAALEAGDIQMSFFSSMPRTDLARLAKNPKFRVGTKGNEAYVIFNTLGFNTREKSLGDVRVRRAIAHSLDLEFYSKDFLLGYGQRAHGPIPTNSNFFIPGAAPDYPYNLNMAEALFDQAGYKRGLDGTRLSLRLFPNTSDDIRMFGTFIQQSLQKVGVKVDYQIVDFAGYLARVDRDWDFDMGTDTNLFRGDPGIGTTIYYHSGVPKGTPWSNQWGWKSAKLDKVTDEAIHELDPAKRKMLYGEFVKIANTEIPVWMAIQQTFVSAVAAHVRNDNNNPRWAGSSWADVWLSA
jgi:peptide/nickel transport system substrate-binding protein